MDKQTFDQLAAKIADGIASEHELAQYNTWFNTHADETYWPAKELGSPDEVKNLLLISIRTEIQRLEGHNIKRLYYRLAGAAVLTICVALAGYFFIKQPTQIAPADNLSYHNDIKPGNSQATLTLANGEKIILTQNPAGKIATQGQTSINAIGGQLVYMPGAETQPAGNNTLTTAPGERLPYPIVLADGTKAWLNAQSSLTFPTNFNGKNREVTLTGEAYFEVKHNESQPFFVKTSKATIQDIGTEFNISAYDNEPAVKTVLYKGSVKVNETLIQPGQQAIAFNKNVKVDAADLAATAAWRQNDFIFHDQDLHTVMRQISRWYNINIVYDHAPEGLRIYAEISRDHNLSVVLKAIEATKQVKFRIDGRTLTVTQ